MRYPQTIPWRSAHRTLAVLASFAMVLALGPLVGTATAQDQPEARRIDDGGVCDPANTDEAPFDDKPADERGDAIDCLWTYNIAQGVSATEFGIEEDTSRQQMVSFLVRLLRAADQHDVNEAPAAAGWDDRDQIANNHRTNADIANEEAIAEGHDDNHFHPRPGAASCAPENTEDHFGECGLVNRASMASFVVRTLAAVAGQEIAPGARDWFNDECPPQHEENVDKLAEVGVVQGRQPGFYDCPADTRRDQMALFIARGMDFLNEEHGVTFTPVGEEAGLVGASFGDHDDSGGLTSGDDVVLEFSGAVATESTVTLQDEDGDQVVLTDEGVDETAEPEQVAATFGVSEDGRTVTVTVNETPQTPLNGEVTIAGCTGIVDAETGEPVDCEGAAVSFTIETQAPVSDDATVTDDEGSGLFMDTGTVSDGDVWRVVFNEVMDPIDGTQAIRVVDGDTDRLDVQCETPGDGDGNANCSYNNERVQIGDETYEPGRVLEIVVGDEGATPPQDLEPTGGNGDGVLDYPVEITQQIGFADADGDGEWNVEASPDTTLEAEGDTSDQPTEDPATGQDPPELATAERSGSQELTLTWSEPIDVIGTADQVTVHEDSAENDCSGAQVTSGQEVSSDDGDAEEVVSLADPLADQTTYEVLVAADHVEDQEANNNAPQCVEFTTGTTA